MRHGLQITTTHISLEFAWRITTIHSDSYNSGENPDAGLRLEANKKILHTYSVHARRFAYTC